MNRTVIDLFDKAILEARNKMLAAKSSVQKSVLDNSLYTIGDDLKEYCVYREVEDILHDLKSEFIDATKEKK